ncbi:4'-phosphopantetheinyl transferase superfamily protein [uncultured Sutterella sp.]|uniref:4'-phosphopantetheinyl transferase family protein n=1 Tax=uncultured Sutterella sp. TaxID=286133 RepID=UPI002617086B|nr:4'-phosphopantetheinyl transferase superfamily protein [uncultured Sutterella sp.]
MRGGFSSAALLLEWAFLRDGSCGRFGISESASGIREPDYSRLPAGFQAENEGYQLLADRIRRAQARECLRTLLIHSGTFSPEGWNRWQSGTYGKPSIPGAGDFSLTHAAGFTAALLAPAHAQKSFPILAGLDAESLAPASSGSERDEAERELHDLMSVMTADERAFIESAADLHAARSRAYALWTRKEAVLKAGGWGLRDEIADLDVLASPLFFLGRCWHWQTLLLKTGNESVCEALESAREALSGPGPEVRAVWITAASDRPFTLLKASAAHS